MESAQDLSSEQCYSATCWACHLLASWASVSSSVEWVGCIRCSPKAPSCIKNSDLVQELFCQLCWLKKHLCSQFSSLKIELLHGDVSPLWNGFVRADCANQRLSGLELPFSCVSWVFLQQGPPWGPSVLGFTVRSEFGSQRKMGHLELLKHKNGPLGVQRDSG